WLLYAPVLLMQALWLDRLYIVGHEATHGKLFPRNRRLNDGVGMLMLLPLAIPLQVFRKIHQFHHGFNRRDVHTSALDVFVSDTPVSKRRRILYKAAWFVGVFGSGYFWYSFASIVIFLFIPTEYAARISPAFKNWTSRDRVVSWLQFLLGVSFHLTVYFVGGFNFWLISLAFPILVFSWIYSLLVYIFHYDTSIGAEVRFNARSLERHWLFSWILMNFNEHATHHAYPNIPWYQLPERREPLPEKYQSNQKVRTVWQAIVQQLKGPKIVYDSENTPRPNGR
nr:fatty acid desaturase [Acidobacteriota bacterium]